MLVIKILENKMMEQNAQAVKTLMKNTGVQ